MRSESLPHVRETHLNSPRLTRGCRPDSSSIFICFVYCRYMLSRYGTEWKNKPFNVRDFLLVCMKMWPHWSTKEDRVQSFRKVSAVKSGLDVGLMSKRSFKFEMPAELLASNSTQFNHSPEVTSGGATRNSTTIHTKGTAEYFQAKHEARDNVPSIHLPATQRGGGVRRTRHARGQQTAEESLHQEAWLLRLA